MQNKLLCGAAIFLCLMAILFDATSKLMSIAIDGTLLSAVVLIIYHLAKNKPKE